MASKEMKLKWVGPVPMTAAKPALDDAGSKGHGSRTVGDELSIVMVAEVD